MAWRLRRKPRDPLELFDVEADNYGFSMTGKGRRPRRYRMDRWGEVLDEKKSVVYNTRPPAGGKHRFRKNARVAFEAARAFLDRLLTQHPYGPPPQASEAAGRLAQSTSSDETTFCSGGTHSRGSPPHWRYTA